MPDLETKQKFDRTQELIKLWVKFHEYFLGVLKGGKPAPGDEQKFLELRSQIAQRYQALSELLGTGQSIGNIHSLDMVTQVLSLEKIPEITELERDKIEADWSAAYISLNRILGSLEATEIQKASISAEERKAQRSSVIPWIVLMVVLGALILVYVVSNRLGQ
jgi:hypothetical protein